LSPAKHRATAKLHSCFSAKRGRWRAKPVDRRASFRTPFGPPDEGGRAQRDGFAKLRSIRHCIADPRQRQFRRPNYKFVRQPKNLKALFSQPGVTGLVGKPLRRDRMARTVNLHDQPTFEADKIKV
jgi:hypothetical protein